MISNLKHSWLLPHNFFLLVSAIENVRRTVWRMYMLILAWKGCNTVDSSGNCRMVEACEPSIWSSPPTSSPELSSRELKGETHMSQVWFFVGWEPNFFLFPFFEPKWQRFLTFIEWDVYQWNASWIFKFFILLHYSVCCVNMHCPLPMKSLQISLSV